MASTSVAIESNLPGQRASGPSWYTRNGARIGYGLSAVAIAIGWINRESLPFTAEDGFGYWLGIVGASMMALLLLYPLRKKIRAMHVLGPTRHWFRAHMILGVLGPILVLYHSRFVLGSLNSRVALFCTLLVAGSGLVGRYLHARVHSGLYGRRLGLSELQERIKLSKDQQTRTASFVPNLVERVQQFDSLVLATNTTLSQTLLLPAVLALKMPFARWKLVRFARQQIQIEASMKPLIAAKRKTLEKVTEFFIDEHFRRVRKVAQFQCSERLLALWHLFHLPFFYMLVLTALIHVLAVHMY